VGGRNPVGGVQSGQWLVVAEIGADKPPCAPLAIDGICSVTETAGVWQASRWQMAALHAHPAGRFEVCERSQRPRPAAWTGKSLLGGAVPSGADGKESFTFPGGRTHGRARRVWRKLLPARTGELFQTREASSFDVTTNGQRFLVNQRVSDSSDTPVTVILNWPQLLKQ
jgi:hypothetical protein